MQNSPAATTISARVLRPVAIGLQARRLDPEAALSIGSVRPDELHDPDARVDMRAACDIWLEAVRLTNDIAFGIRTAELLRPGTYDVLDYAARSCATYGQALDLYAKSVCLLHPAVRVELRVDDHEAVLRHNGVGPDALVPPWSEYILAALVVLGRQTTEVPFSPRAVHFVHENSDDSLYREFFGCPVHFGSDVNALVLDPEIIALPQRQGDPDLNIVLQRHLLELMTRAPATDNFVLRVRSVIREALGEGSPTAATVGRRLGLSARTLGRRLAAEGTGFQQLLDDVRRELAMRHLGEERLPIDDVAAILGFADGRVFRRAFKRWTGRTPSEYRRTRGTCGEDEASDAVR